MKSEIKVPAMGESITEVLIGAILSPSGSTVKTDAEILEIETDKVNQVLYAPQAGRVELTVKSGDTVRVGQTIGFIEAAEGQPAAKLEASPKPPAEEKKTTKPLQAAIQEQTVVTESKDTARYTKEDLLAEIKQPQVKTASFKSTEEKEEAVSRTKSTKEEEFRETRKPLSNIRRVIAQRLVESQQNTASLTTFNEIDLSQVIALREKYKEPFMKKYGVKLGFMSFFVEACVSALKSIPSVNSYLDGNDLVSRHYYDIGIAVGTERGLIVPVLRDCDQRSFADIELAIEAFAKKAKEGKLTMQDLQGGGFTITNGGVYGSLLSTPILNPPQSAILGMHKIEKRPVVIDDQIVIRPMMYVALTYDHRLIDGREAVSFLVHLKNILEDPSRLLLEI